MLRSSFKWASQHEFVPVEETPSSVEQGSAPQGFKELLVRLVKAVLINKPLCIYQCLATTLEAELDRRTLWEIQFSQYSRSMNTFSIATQNVPFHLLPSTIRKVGDASDILHGKPALRNLTSGLDEKELALSLGCFPNNETRSLDPKRLKPFLAFEFPHGGADATRDEMRVVSLFMPQNSTLLAVKTEGWKHLPEEPLSTTASGVKKPVLGELNKDGSAADMIIHSHLLDSSVEGISPIRPTTEYLLRSHNSLATDGDQDELQDGQRYLLNNWQDDSFKETLLNEDIDFAGQTKVVQNQTRENSLHMLDTKPRDVESIGAGQAYDSSDRPSYIPRGDRLADAMLHFDAETASVQDLELHEDVAAVASTDQCADALNKLFARYYQEPDQSHSGQDFCIVPTRYDVAVTASNPDIAVLHETSESNLRKASRQTIRKQDSIIDQSENELADAADTDESVMQDEPQTKYPENSSQGQDVPDFYLKSDAEQKCEESVRALEEQECHHSSYLESAEIDELEYLTPPNETFKQSKEELQEEDEFHTPRAMFPDDLVLADNVETSSMSVHVLHDKLLLAAYRSGIEELQQSNELTQNEGVTTESVVELLSLGKETTNDMEINDEYVIQELLHSDDPTQDEKLKTESIIEAVLHGKESIHDNQTFDHTQVQELSHSDDSTPDEVLTIESVVEGVLSGKESIHDKQICDQSQIQELSRRDDSTLDEELTIESVVEGVLHGKESKHDMQDYGNSQIQELSHSDDPTQDEELTIESVLVGVLHGKESIHGNQTCDHSQIQEISHSDDPNPDEELTIEPVDEGVLHLKESIHDTQTFDHSQIPELSPSDDSTPDEELTTKSVLVGVLHGKESIHDKQTCDHSQIQGISHCDDKTPDEELTIESIVESVLHGKESKHDMQDYDHSQMQELSPSDDSTPDEELTTKSVLVGALHGKESIHDKQTCDHSQIQDISHSNDPTPDEELTIKYVDEGVLHLKESKHDKQTYEQSWSTEVSHCDDSTPDEELTTKSVLVGGLNGKKFMHDKQTHDPSWIHELLRSDDPTSDEELTIESVVEGVLHGKETIYDTQTYDHSQIPELSHSDDPTQNEELTIESVDEGVLHLKESIHNKQTSEQSWSTELSHSDDSTPDEELITKSALVGVPHGKEFIHVNQTYDHSQIQEHPHSDDPTPDEELKIESVVERALQGKESIHDNRTFDHTQVQELSHSDDSIPDEVLTIESVVEGVLSGKESTHDKHICDQSQIQELSHRDDSTLDEELTIESVVEGVLHGTESNHDKITNDRSWSQELSHSDDSTPDEVLTIESVVGVLQGKETIHDSQICDHSQIQELSHSNDPTPNELTIDSVLVGVLHGKESKHDMQDYENSQIQELSHSDDHTQDGELTIESVLVGVLHGKESIHDKQTCDHSQIQEISHSDDPNPDEELTIESVDEGVLHLKESIHDIQTFDHSQIPELSPSDDSTPDEELTTKSVLVGALHGKESIHDKQTCDHSQIQDISHSNDPTSDEELTIKYVDEGVLHLKESIHDKQTYEHSWSTELSRSDDSTPDEELTTKSVLVGVPHGKEFIHDNQTYDHSQIQEISQSDDPNWDEELTIESVDEGVLLGKESIHDKQTYDQSQILELSHSHDPTPDEELASVTVVEEVLHGKESINDEEISDASRISEIWHHSESTPGKEFASVAGEFLHVKQFAIDKEASDELVIEGFSHSNKSRYSEELTSGFVVEEFPNVKGFAPDNDLSDKALSQRLLPTDEEGERLKLKIEFQEFPHSDGLLQESIVLEEFGEFKSSGISDRGEVLKFDLAMNEIPQNRESTCRNEVITNPVCGEETTLDSLQVKETVNDSAFSNQMTVSSADETEMLTRSSLEDEIHDEFILGEETKMHASLIHFEFKNEKEVLKDSAIDGKRSQKVMLQLEEASESACDEANPTLENVEIKLSGTKFTVYLEEMTHNVQPDEEMIHEAKLGEEIGPEREHIGLKKSDLANSKDIKYESNLLEEICEPENSEIKSPDSVFSKGKIITSDSLLLEEITLKSERGEMVVSDIRYIKEITPESLFHEGIQADSDNSEVKITDSVYSKQITPESLSHEVIQPESENSEVKPTDSVYSKEITPKSLLHEGIQPDFENSEVKIADSVYSRDITSESLHDKDATAEDLQIKTLESSERVTEAANPDENAISVRPVKEPLLYGQKVYPNYSHASESNFPSVANKPTMSEEKTAYMLEWDEMNLDRMESDAIFHKQCTSSEHHEQDNSFQEKEECESSLTESESDTGTGQPSVEVPGDHPDCFSNFSFGPSLGREARIRLKWYSISTSCSDVLEEEDEEDESNVTNRGHSTFEVEAIQDGACNSSTLLQDNVNRYGEELTQSQQGESMAFDVTEGELTNEMVSGKDLFDNNVSSERKDVGDADAALFPSGENKQELTPEDDDQDLGKLVQVTEISTNSRVLPENSESLVAKMVTENSGEDVYSNLCEKKMSTSDSLYLSETFTVETGLLATSTMGKTKEMDDDRSDMVKECQVIEEPNQLKSALDVDTGDETQVDKETVVGGKHMAGEAEDEAEKAGVLEESKDAQMITEVIDDKFTTVETEHTEHSSSKTEFIQLMDVAMLKVGSFEEMSAPDETDESRIMHLTDTDDAHCLLETETIGKEETNTVQARDVESLEATEGNRHKTDETEKTREDLLRVGAAIANFTDEATETSVIDETVEDDGMIEMPADEFQGTGWPEIQSNVTGNAACSRALDSVQKGDGAELQHISLEPVTEAIFKEISTEETTNSFGSSSNLSHKSSYQTFFSLRVGLLRPTKHPSDHFQLFDKDSEETDMNETFEKGVDHPVNEVTQLDSHKNQGMPAERNYYEAITPEKAILFLSAAPGQSHIDSDEESAAEGQGEEMLPAYSTDMRDAGEATDEHEHIVIAASMHSHTDTDEPNLVDEGDRCLYEEPDNDGRESEPRRSLAHPSTRNSQWEYRFENDEIIVPQKVDIYHASPMHRYHGENDSDLRDEVNFYFGEETSTGLNTTEKSSCAEEDERAVNEQPLCAPENCPTDVFSFPLDGLKAGGETKLNDRIAPSDESSTGKNCRTNEPLEHEAASSEWPPLPQFLAPLEEYTTSAQRQSIRYRDDEWPQMGISAFNPGVFPASDIQDSDGEEASIYWTEPVTVEPSVAESVSLPNPSDKSDVAAEVYYNSINDRFEARNIERLRAFFNTPTLEGEDWPPMPEFAMFHNESNGMESTDAIGEALSATKAIDGITGGQMSAIDSTTVPENQLMDSSEQWPPLPDFLMEELISGGPTSCFDSEPSSVEQIGILLKGDRKELYSFTEESIFGTNSCATDVTEMAPSTTWQMSQTDKDEASSKFFNEDNSDDQIVNEYMKLSVVNQLVLEIVSSAKQSVQELANRETLPTFESTPTEAGISSEPKESALGFSNESPLLSDLLSDDCNEFASDSEYEEASIYWTQPTIVKPPVADSLSVQSSPNNNAPEACLEDTWKTTEPQNNNAGFEVRQFCAVASSAFTDLTKVTGSQGDMKSHHNIQSHIELGVMACQSWSDLDILPCGSSKSLQLIGAPELSSWVAGSDEANRKWREDEQVVRRQSIEAESQSAYTEGEAIGRVMEAEGVDSGFKIQATEEPLLGCRRDSASIENERASRGPSVHIWMPVEEEGLYDGTASKGVVAKGSKVISPMELPGKAFEQQSSDVAEGFVALKRTAEPSRTVSAESNLFSETIPILVSNDCSTVMKSPDTDDCGIESNKVELKDPKQENIFAGILDAAEPSGGSTWGTDLNSVMQLEKNDLEVHLGEFEGVEKDNETKSEDDSVPAEQTVDLDEPMKQTETSSVELVGPTGISASETGLLAKQFSNILKELGTEITIGSKNWSQMDQFSADELCTHAPKMSDVQEIPIFYDLEAQQEEVVKSAGASDEMSDLQERLMFDPREPQLLPLGVRNQVSCSLCKTDRTALSGYPDTAATPLSEPDEWIQMGNTWLIEDEMLANAEPYCRRNETLGTEEETNFLSSFSSTVTAADEITICKNRAYSPIIENVETVKEEVKQGVSACIDASLTHASSFKNDKTEASSESALTISSIDPNCHLNNSPKVFEVEDTNVGLDQDDWGQDEVDEMVKLAVAASMHANLTQPASFDKNKIDEKIELAVSAGVGANLTQAATGASFENDKAEANGESSSTISFIDTNFHLSNSPQVVEMEDTNVGLDQDDLMQDEVDEVAFGVQEHHFQSNESTSDEQMENRMFCDTSKTRIEQQHSFGTVSVGQLNLIKPDGSAVLNLGDSTEESDPSFMQRMSLPGSSGAELGFVKLCPRTSSNQLESEVVVNSSSSASLSRKGEYKGQNKNEERLVEEEQLTSELSPIFHFAQDAEPNMDSLKWEDGIQDTSASEIRDENRVALEDSQSFDSDVKREVGIFRQHEDLGNVQDKDLDKDSDSDPNKDCREGIHAENENEPDDHTRGLDKNHDDRDKTDNEDEGKNCSKDNTNPDMHQDKNDGESQDKKHDKGHDVDHDENLEKCLDKDHNEDQDMDQNKDVDMSHCKNQDESQRLTYDGAESDTDHIKENDEYVEPIPPHMTKSETELVFSLQENRADFNVEPVDKGSTHPMPTAEEVVTIIPMDVLDQSPRSPQSPSLSSAFLIASQQDGYKTAKLGEQETIRSTITKFERDSQKIAEEQTVMEQGLSDDGQKTYCGTTSSKLHVGTYASTTAEGIVQSNIDATSAVETDDDKVVSKSNASNTIEEIFLSNVSETRATETEEAIVVSKCDGLNASKTDGETDSSQVGEGVVASETEEVESSADDERKVLKNDDGTVQPHDGVVTSEIDMKSVNDGTVSPKP